MEFFNEIGSKVEEHEYIYIFEKKIENKYSVYKWRSKQVLWHCTIMLIYANYRENGAADMKLFFTKRCVTDILTITKKREKNLNPFKQEAWKNKMLGPSGHLLMHLSVKGATTLLS